MIRLNILIFISCLCLGSCSEIGEYYSTDKEGEVENIQLSTNSKIHCDFAANIIQSDFNAMLYVKLLDTTLNNFTIKNVSIKINNNSDSLAEKMLQYINEPDKVKFSIFSELADLQKKIYTGLPLQFIYRFDKNTIIDKKLITVDIVIHLIENNNDIYFAKSFVMYRHKRYKSWFASM